MKQISPSALKQWLAEPEGVRPMLLDVREPWEFEICRIEGAQPMPMGSVPTRFNDLDPDAPVVVICHHGMRSMQVALFLERQGFSWTYNLIGGVHAWSEQVDPAMPKY